MTPMHTDDRRYDPITEKIIGCAFKVGSRLGAGFAEKCYHNALKHELEKAGLRVQSKVELRVWYDGIVVGDYEADLIVEDVVLVALKACKALTRAITHSASTTSRRRDCPYAC